MNTAFEPREFRDALSSFATGVTIVTSRDKDNEPIGMTASSFNSVSVDPPLILWSVTKSALSANAYKEAEYFAVHILSAHQSDLSNKFATSGENKFAGLDYDYDAYDMPALPNVACRFSCKTWAVHEGGDHWIIVGEVLGFERNVTEGLIFAGGSYAASAPLHQVVKSSGSPNNAASGHIENMLYYRLSRSYHQLAADFQTLIRDSNLTVPQMANIGLFGR